MNNLKNKRLNHLLFLALLLSTSCIDLSKVSKLNPTEVGLPGNSTTQPSSSSSLNGETYQPNNGPILSQIQITQNYVARKVSVSNQTEFLQALSNAQPGDYIEVNDGTYTFVGSNIRINVPGLVNRPIFLKAKNKHQARINFCNVEGFLVSVSDWIIEDFHIQGSCNDGSNNEHAFHLVGGSSRTVVRGNKIVNFMSHIKTNCNISGNNFVCSSGIKIIGNRFFNTINMPGSSPFNVINIDGTNDIEVRDNLLHDFTSANSGKSATGIYPKMHSDRFLIENNMVVCLKNSTNPNTMRGINVGDSLDGNIYCKDQKCTSYNGIIRNNIILNCQGGGNSFGLGIINQDQTKYLHNTIINAKKNWFDTVAPSADNVFKNNLVSQLWESQSIGHTPYEVTNFKVANQAASDYFQDARNADFSLLQSLPSDAKVQLDQNSLFDFCGNKRQSLTSVGAIDLLLNNRQQCIDRIKSLYNSMYLY